MKKIIAVFLVFLMAVSFAVAEEKTLPQPDDEGKTTYLGEVGWLFDEEGNFVKESLFDQAVLWIEEIPGVYDACIIVEKGKYYDRIMLAIVASPTPSVAEAKEIADSAIRQMGTLFGMTDEYEGPDAESFGTLYDDYPLLVSVFSKDGKQICMGAISSHRAHITW